jgi:uncharacterized protein YyaL (SSP411 family)
MGRTRHGLWVWGGAILAVLALNAVLQTIAPASADETGWGLPSEAASGVHRYTNRLSDSRDPYLLLHAHNPVDWYPWGPEALAKAKTEGKPIFVSIGYSTCYWCHVAERLIYSDPNIAQSMNEWFVNVKVDREQRPDIDRVYMLATQIMTGHGGWPNNVFLTPDLKPFFAGSYFPLDDDPRAGPGFRTVIAALHELWSEHRTDRVMPVAERVLAAMLRVQGSLTAGNPGPIEPGAWLVRGSQAVQRRFDPEHGGLGNTGPKFPQVPSLELLLADYRLNRDAIALDHLTRALDAMASGGIHDQLGGGFHRYSTEPSWSIPHFEKMLYDNTQLLRLYAAAHEDTRNPLYRAVALDIGQYLKREMMAAEGGFFTAQDSQVNGAEGASYLWTKDEIVALLGAKPAQKFLTVYTLSPLPTGDVPTGAQAADRKPGGVLRVRVPLGDTLKQARFSDVTQMLSSLAPERALLLAARAKRQQPARDEKIITGLNGLVIAALAQSSGVLQQPDFLAWARTAAERLWALAYDPKTGALQHEIFRGKAQTGGYLADYAMLGDGFATLFDITKEPVWRDRAAALADNLIGRFGHPDGALSASPDENNLLIPVADSGDSEVPSGTSVALDLLLRLAKATGETQYETAAARLLRHLSGQIEARPGVWPAAIAAVNFHLLKDTALAAVAIPSSDPAGKLSHMPETADHVRAAAALKADANGDEIVVTLQVDDGYHINANPASLDYLIATSLTFDRLKPSKVEYPKAVRFKSALAPNGLDVYEGEVTLIAQFARGALLDQKNIQGTVRVQACDTQICLPPSDLPVSLPSNGE